MYSIEDENNYLGMSYVFASGKVFPDEADIKLVSILQVGEHLVSKYPPGNSILLIPFILFNWKGVFLLNLLLHIISFIFFVKILKQFNLPAIYSLLFLYFPSLTLYMRTIMSDYPTAFFTLAGFFAYLLAGNWLFLSGVLIGYSCFIRYTNIVIFGAFLIVLCYPFFRNLILKENSYDSLKRLIIFILGFLPFAIIILYYNYYTLGSPFLTVYSILDINNYAFGWEHFKNNFLFYLKALIILYPFMIISIIFYKGRERVLVHLIFFGILVFYSFYFHLPNFGTGLQRYIVGIRFLLPAIFTGILTYAVFLEKISEKTKFLRTGIFIILNLLIIPYIGISYRHYNYLKDWAVFRDFYYANTIGDSLTVCDGEIPKLIQKIWGKRDYKQYVFVDKKLPVEDDIKKALEDRRDVYLALLIRPFREDRNIYAEKYRDELLMKYRFENVGTKILHTGKLEIYKLIDMKKNE